MSELVDRLLLAVHRALLRGVERGDMSANAALRVVEEWKQPTTSNPSSGMSESATGESLPVAAPHGAPLYRLRRAPA